MNEQQRRSVLATGAAAFERSQASVGEATATV
jgi:hypothetical protein